MLDASLTVGKCGTILTWFEILLFSFISEIFIKINDTTQNDHVEIGLKLMWARITIFGTKE